MFGRVEQLQADVVAGVDPKLFGQSVRESGGALVQLAVRPSRGAAHHRFAVSDGVGNELEQVGDVEREYGRSLPWLT
jgi:hypothetical protein